MSSCLLCFLWLLVGVSGSFDNCSDPICIPHNYIKENPPTTDTGGPLNIDAKFKIRSIFNVDNYHNTISMILFLQQTWKDNRLRGYENRWVTVSKSTMDKLWTPTLYFPAMTKMEVGKAFEDQMLLRLKQKNNETMITFQSDFSLTVTCPMHYSRFPFDKHICGVLVGSSFLDNTSIIFTMKTKPAWRDKPNIIRDFSIELYELSEDERTNSVDWDGDDHSVAGFKLKLTRRYSRYIYMYYLPTAMFVLVSWISFLIPPTSYPARVALPITILLVLVNILNNVIANTPNETEGLTAIAIWIIGTILFVFSVFLGYATILVNIRKDENKKSDGYTRMEEHEANNNEREKDVKKNDTTILNLIDYVMLYTLMSFFILFSIIYGTMINCMA